MEGDFVGINDGIDDGPVERKSLGALEGIVDILKDGSWFGSKVGFNE